MNIGILDILVGSTIPGMILSTGSRQAGLRTAAVEFWKHLLDASSSLFTQGHKLLFRI